MPTEPVSLFLTLGTLFLVGLIADVIGRCTPLPRVTLLLIAGVAMGPAGFGLLETPGEKGLSLVANLALVMIGFLVGGKLTLDALRTTGRAVLSVSVWVTLATLVMVMSGLLLLGIHPVAAMLLAAIATATDPAAVVDVVNKHSADGRFSRTLVGVVAIDDVWGLLAFSMMLWLAGAIQGDVDLGPVVVVLATEIGGAVLLGMLLGIPMALATGRVHPGEPTQAEALGVVLVCAGLAMYLQVSFLLACIVLGCVVVNLARHHERPFHAIEGIQWPFLILFFILAGASLDLDQMRTMGITTFAYITLRVLGRVAGGWIGAIDKPLTRRYVGVALLPQAGIALGMALVAADRYPEVADTILPVVITACVLFEIIGPIFTRAALAKVPD